MRYNTHLLIDKVHFLQLVKHTLICSMVRSLLKFYLNLTI